MARLNAPCPFCGPKPVVAREEFEALEDHEARNDFMSSICDRCWDAITANLDEKPVNEAEVADGLR